MEWLTIPRVGNVGSLSWFATVYVERQVSFTAAYGLTLCFMVVASIMLIAGKRYYGATAPSTCFLVQLADPPQSRFLMSEVLSPKRSGSSYAPAVTASEWPAQIPPTSLSTVTRPLLGADSLSKN